MQTDNNGYHILYEEPFTGELYTVSVILNNVLNNNTKQMKPLQQYMIKGVYRVWPALGKLKFFPILYHLCASPMVKQAASCIQ